MIKCIAPADPIDELLWKAYLEKHGCQVLLADDHYEVTLPAGASHQRIGGELEPVYRITLPDGANLATDGLQILAVRMTDAPRTCYLMGGRKERREEDLRKNLSIVETLTF